MQVLLRCEIDLTMPVCLYTYTFLCWKNDKFQTIFCWPRKLDKAWKWSTFRYIVHITLHFLFCILKLLEKLAKKLIPHNYLILIHDGGYTNVGARHIAPIHVSFDFIFKYPKSAHHNNDNWHKILYKAV